MGADTKIFVRKDEAKRLFIDDEPLLKFLSDMLGKRWHWFRKKWGIEDTFTSFTSAELMAVLTSRPKLSKDWKRMMTACQKYHLVFQSDYDETDPEGCIDLSAMLEEIKKVVAEKFDEKIQKAD